MVGGGIGFARPCAREVHMHARKGYEFYEGPGWNIELIAYIFIGFNFTAGTKAWDDGLTLL